VIVAVDGRRKRPSRRPGEVTPGQFVVNGNVAALLIVRVWFALLQVLLLMVTGPLMVIWQVPKIVIVATTPVPPAPVPVADALTFVVLVAVNSHVPNVVTDATLASPSAEQFVPVPKATGLWSPAVVLARSPVAVSLVSAVGQETVFPLASVSVGAPSDVAVTSVPCGSQVAAEADETPTNDTASTTPHITLRKLLIAKSF
jgi:hypothetical protein